MTDYSFNDNRSHWQKGEVSVGAEFKRESDEIMVVDKAKERGGWQEQWKMAD